MANLGGIKPFHWLFHFATLLFGKDRSGLLLILILVDTMFQASRHAKPEADSSEAIMHGATFGSLSRPTVEKVQDA